MYHFNRVFQAYHLLLFNKEYKTKGYLRGGNMNQILIHYPERETNRVQYNTFSETDSANYYSTVTPLSNAAIEIIKNQFIYVNMLYDGSNDIVVTNE